MKKSEAFRPQPKKLPTPNRKVVRLSQSDLVKTSYLESEQSLPLLVEPVTGGADLSVWAAHNLPFIRSNLLRYGGLLFRGFDVKTRADFESFLGTVSSELMHYMEGATPRTQLSDKVYTSTEYPADQSIALHNELTYVLKWPMRIWFFCLQPAAQRGETPIADMRKVYQRLNPRIVERFKEKRWMLVRNFGAGLSLPWQTSFHATSKEEVEAYCRQARIELEWRDYDRLRTRQVRPAVAEHPQTGEMVWFNHIAFWHVSSLESQVREAMLSVFGEEDLPYNTYYGDGTPIEESIVTEIREAYRQERIEFGWQTGDVLMLDNMLVAHGRNPYAGARKVLVGMGESYGWPAL